MDTYQTPKYQGGGVVHFINIEVPKRLEEGAEVEVGHLAGHKKLVPADGIAVAFRYNRLCVMGCRTIGFVTLIDVTAHTNITI